MSAQPQSVQDKIGPRQAGLHSKETSVTTRSGLLRGTIEDIVLYVVDDTTSAAPAANIHFWGNDSHNTTNLGVVKLWGSEVLAGDFTREASGATTSIWRAYVGGLDIPYADEDRTGEFHVTVENEGVQTWASGRSRLEFGFRTEWGA